MNLAFYWNQLPLLQKSLKVEKLKDDNLVNDCGDEGGSNDGGKGCGLYVGEDGGEDERGAQSGIAIIKNYIIRSCSIYWN